MRIPRILARFRQFVFAVFVTALTFLSPAFACEENQIECNNQCYDAFTVTLTDSATSFSFYLTAKGTFCVDWGGTAGVQDVSRSAVATALNASSTVSAPAGFGKTIKIGGLASGYSTTSNVSAISFYTNTRTNVKAISGSLGAIFPTLSDNTANLTGTALLAVQPSFYQAFYQCTNLESSLPDNLFNGLKGMPIPSMFYRMFYGCSKLTGPVSENLLADLTTGNSTIPNNMLYMMFYNCSNFGSGEYIPASVLENIKFANDAQTNTAQYMFYGTGFRSNCPKGTQFVRAHYSNKASCSLCVAGQYNDVDNSTSTANACKSCSSVGDGSYTESEAGATANSQCYKVGTTSCSCSAANAATCTGTAACKEYYNSGTCSIIDSNVCDIVSVICESGYKTTTAGTACEPITYSISFNGNGNTGGSTSGMSNLSYGSPYTLTSNGFTRTGYDFDGWCVGATTCAAADKLANSASVSNLTTTDGATITLYAQWTPTPYTITLNPNGGTLDSGVVNPISYNIESGTVNLPDDPDITQLGYIFDGWCETIDCDSGNETPIKQFVPTSSNIGDKNMYAQWTSNACDITNHWVPDPNNLNNCICATGYTDISGVCTPTLYTITYNTNGGTLSGTYPTDYTIESNTITLPDDTNITKLGYSFAGWYDNAGLTGTAVTSIATGSTGNKVYYAGWTANTYNVTYTCDGVTAQTEQATYGTSYTGLDSANVCSEPTGYTLSSFSCSNGVTLPVSDWNTDSAVTCSATTSPKQYTVTYECDGVQTEQDTVTYDVNYTGRISANVCSEPTGYTLGSFVCTNDTTGNTETIATTATPWEIDSGVTCSAAFIPKTYNVTYKCGGITATVGSQYQTATYGASYAMADSTTVCATTGYTPDSSFVCTDSGNNVVSLPTNNWNTDSAVTCSAALTPKTYTVTYTCDGVTAQTEQATYGTSYTGLDSANVCSEPTGYTLSSFSCSNGVTLPVSDWNTDSAVTCSAALTPKTYTVTYTCDGVTAQEDTATYDVSYSVRDSATVCAAQGYTPSLFTCVPNISSGVWNTDANVTCSATRTGNTIALTWANGGHGSAPATPATCTYGYTFSMPAALTETGWTFDKWNVNGNQFNANSQGVNCDYATLGVASGSATITASWTATEYTITYNTNGGACANNSCTPISYTISSSTITLPAPTKTGYTFNGWYTDSGFANQITQITMGSYGDLDLYAKWAPTIYTINYELYGGTNSVNNPSSYNIESANITLADPTRNNYVFNGWYTDSGFVDQITQITTGSYGDLDLYAKWVYDCPAGYPTVNSTNDGCECPTGFTWDQTRNTCVLSCPTGSIANQDNTGCVCIDGYDESEYDSLTPLPAAKTSGHRRAYWNLSESSCKQPSNTMCTDGLKQWHKGDWVVSFGTNNKSRYEGIAFCDTKNMSGSMPAWGVPNGVSDPTQGNCWCRIDSYIPDTTASPMVKKNLYVWFQKWHYTSISDCSAYCAWECADYIGRFGDYNGYTDFMGTVSAHLSPCVYDCPAGTSVNATNDGCVADACETVSGGFCTECPTGYTLRVLSNGHENNDNTAVCDLNEYTITYDLDGGSLPSGITNPIKYTVESVAMTLNAPTRTGYTFAGWCTEDSELNPNCTVLTNDTFVPDSSDLGDKTFYAKWTPITYTITYYTNDGTLDSGINNPTNYTIESSTITLPTGTEITRTGYVFAGWYNNPSLTGTVVTSVPSGSYGNKEYYAKWLDCASVVPANASATVNVVNNTCSYVITCDAGYSHNTGSGYVIDNIIYTGVAAELPSSITGCETSRVYLTWNPENADNASSVSGVGFCDVGATFGVPVTEPTRTGYTFAGWDVTNVTTP